MSAQDQNPLEFIDSRWREYKERPRIGDVFVARRRSEVFPTLFKMGDDKRPVYYNDPNTILGSASEIITHWLYVGEGL